MKQLAMHGGTPLRQVPFPVWPISGPREEELMRQVLLSGQWGGFHEFVGQFEELFARLHDARYGVAVANGSIGLELALLAANIGPGDEVIVPAHSFIATASAVSRVGATPVFVDIDRDSFNMNLDAMEKEIGENTKAVIPVHFGGLICDAAEMERLQRLYKFRVIEDAAHAHGAEWNGARAGGMGLAGVFSFQNSKAMTAGEGGIVISSDDDFMARARSIANGGRRSEGGWFEHFELGTNLRITGFQAAILLAQLERLPDQIRVRGENARIVREGLVRIPGVNVQDLPAAISVHTHYLLPGWIDSAEFGAGRDDFVAALEAEGVPVRPFYPHPLYKNPVFKNKDIPSRTARCPVAEAASRDSFWLPQRVLMGTEDDTRDVVRAVEKIYEVFKPKKPSGKPN
jgi:dTDP-4-amino-4,6-dideoxygalactose transaminase